jgi:hypothetical protein
VETSLTIKETNYKLTKEIIFWKKVKTPPTPEGKTEDQKTTNSQTRYPPTPEPAPRTPQAK